MRFKVDENLPVELALRLQEAGHDATTVKEQAMIGEPDRVIADACRREDRALLTFDLHFADIRRYPPEAYSGLIVLRLSGQDKQHVLAVFERVVPLLDSEPLSKHLWIVDERRVRVRGQSP